MSNETAKSSGIGLMGMLFLVFVVMRLTDHIDWAWYWVAAPLWMPLAIVLAALGAAALGLGVVYLACMPFNAYSSRKRRKYRASMKEARENPASDRHKTLKSKLGIR